ncbi:hypothetical protein AB1J88_11630 [Pseudomonas sp. S8]|uniref:hypothetical protein n=1 Tax=Pseudomonas sp. S8 TaxID=211136 RepID=UPI003D2DE69E
MEKVAQQKKHTRIVLGNMETVLVHSGDGSVKALLVHADGVVEKHATKSLSSSILGQKTGARARLMRAPHLSDLERDMAELKKVVAALAVRSVVHEDNATAFDAEEMTVLKAEKAYQLLDNPPEPTEALRSLLTLR